MGRKKYAKHGAWAKTSTERSRLARINPVVTDKIEALFTCDYCGYQCRMFLSRGLPPFEQCPSCNRTITDNDALGIDKIIEHNTGGTPIPEQSIAREQPKRLLGTPLEMIENHYLPTNEQLWDKVRKR